MKRSTEKILVTHVGSLVRPMSIRNVLSARDHGQPYDEAAYEKLLREEVAAVVRQQANVGVDIVSDGEYGKAGWIRYVAERLGGFVHREFRAGDHEATPNHLIAWKTMALASRMAERPTPIAAMWQVAASVTPSTDHRLRRNPFDAETTMQLSALGPSGMPAANQIVMKTSHSCSDMSAASFAEPAVRAG